MNKKVIMYIVWGIVGVLALACVAFCAVYFWPNRSSALTTPLNIKKMSYADATKQIAAEQKSDAARANFASNCATRVFSHGKKTTKAVVMYHGITACPQQYDTIAKYFYNAGYNVYVPLAPLHGTTKNPRAISGMTTTILADYMKSSLGIATGLGDEVGAVGISGGADLVTWASQHSDVLSRALLLSPFYAPAASKAPSWQLPLLITLYGNNILPDQTQQNFSVRALAKYLMLDRNYNKDLRTPSLKHLAIITSEGDEDIDLNLAHTRAETIASANNLSFQQTRLSAQLGTKHDIASPDGAGVASNQAQLNDLYLSFYEGRQPAKEL